MATTIPSSLYVTARVSNTPDPETLPTSFNALGIRRVGEMVQPGDQIFVYEPASGSSGVWAGHTRGVVRKARLIVHAEDSSFHIEVTVVPVDDKGRIASCG